MFLAPVGALVSPQPVKSTSMRAGIEVVPLSMAHDQQPQKVPSHEDSKVFNLLPAMTATLVAFSSTAVNAESPDWGMSSFFWLPRT
jgi:hypothetical protein